MLEVTWNARLDQHKRWAATEVEVAKAIARDAMNGGAKAAAQDSVTAIAEAAAWKEAATELQKELVEVLFSHIYLVANADLTSFWPLGQTYGRSCTLSGTHSSLPCLHGCCLVD